MKVSHGYFLLFKPGFMRLSIPTCIKVVDDLPVCPYCQGMPIKNGFSPSRKQRYLCKGCNKSFLSSYKNLGYQHHIPLAVKSLLKAGCGIRSISGLLGISVNTVLHKIAGIASRIKKPLVAFGKAYEMDELRTFIQRKDKPVWIAYAMRLDTGEVIDFKVGCRSNKTLGSVIDTLLLAVPKVIHTDRLINYKTLIPSALHKTKAHGINHIERRNLTLRTHLKRLSRKSICFSRSKVMLEACLRIYFWG